MLCVCVCFLFAHVGGWMYLGTCTWSSEAAFDSKFPPTLMWVLGKKSSVIILVH